MTNNQLSTATNITGPDVQTNKSSDTRKYFNNFYSIDFNITSGANDAVVAFFEQYTSNQATAKNLAASVVYTALAQELNPLAVLAEFQNLPKGQLDNYLTAFLNSNRAPTSVLGIKGTTKTSPYITRSILL